MIERDKETERKRKRVRMGENKVEGRTDRQTGRVTGGQKDRERGSDTHRKMEKEVASSRLLNTERDRLLESNIKGR